VELLVVIAIIGILIGMLLPAVQQVREAARRIECGNKMRQLSLAMHNYESSFKNFPSGNITREIPPGATAEFKDVLGRAGLNWHAIILPFIEQAPLFSTVDEITEQLSIPERAHGNADLTSTVVPNLICPSCPMDEINTERSGGEDHAKSNYVGIWGIEVNGNSDYDDLAANKDVYDPSTYSGILYLDSKTTFGEISDGTSNTFLIAERDGALLGGIDTDGLPFVRAAATWCSGQQANWANQCLAPISQELDFIINTVETNRQAQWNAISSQHPGGAPFGRADGSVQFVTDTVDGEVYEAYGTKAGGEVNEEL